MALFDKFLIGPKMLEFLHRASNIGSRWRLHPSSKPKTELTHTLAELLPTWGKNPDSSPSIEVVPQREL